MQVSSRDIRNRAAPPCSLPPQELGPSPGRKVQESPALWGEQREGHGQHQPSPQQRSSQTSQQRHLHGLALTSTGTSTPEQTRKHRPHKGLEATGTPPAQAEGAGSHHPPRAAHRDGDTMLPPCTCSNRQHRTCSPQHRALSRPEPEHPESSTEPSCGSGTRCPPGAPTARASPVGGGVEAAAAQRGGGEGGRDGIAVGFVYRQRPGQEIWATKVGT